MKTWTKKVNEPDTIYRISYGDWMDRYASRLVSLGINADVADSLARLSVDGCDFTQDLFCQESPDIAAEREYNWIISD